MIRQSGLQAYHLLRHIVKLATASRDGRIHECSIGLFLKLADHTPQTICCFACKEVVGVQMLSQFGICTVLFLHLTGCQPDLSLNVVFTV